MLAKKYIVHRQWLQSNAKAETILSSFINQKIRRRQIFVQIASKLSKVINENIPLQSNILGASVDLTFSGETVRTVYLDTWCTQVKSSASINPCHALLSKTITFNSNNFNPVNSLTPFKHLQLGLPFLRFSSSIPSVTSFFSPLALHA